MNDTTHDWLKPFERRFVDKGFAVTTADSIKPWVDKLLARDLGTAEELEQWLTDCSELQCIIGEDASKRYVAMTCDTKDEAKRDAYLKFVREIQPKLTEWQNAIDRKYYESPARDTLDKATYGRLDKMIATSIELYSEKNIPLEVKLSELSQNYQSVTGAWTVEFDGKKRTMPQMSTYLYKTDRALRERAWHAMVEQRLADIDPLEKIFDEMMTARNWYAQNVGCVDYRDYCFKAKLRDYTPNDCFTFHEAIEKAAVPLMNKLIAKRKELMKLDALRPWDITVDPLGRPPLEPFKEVEELKDGVEKIFALIDPRFGERFASIRGAMDLDSRDGKAPGGYQTTYEEQRTPFIFVNAAGVHSDIITLLHEGGHAFHTLMCREQPVVQYRHAGMEFSEVASMTQELFANDFLHVFYPDEENKKRAMMEQFERVVGIFQWVATVDAFQHWLYTNSGHSHEQRAEAWLKTYERFEIDIDWSGLNPDIKKYAWHRQLHIFEVPFYYVEYAIAQMGAIQLYRNYKHDPAKTVEQYLHALSLGGSRPPHELFEAAGISFDFSVGALSSLMAFMEEEIDAL